MPQSHLKVFKLANPKPVSPASVSPGSHLFLFLAARPAGSPSLSCPTLTELSSLLGAPGFCWERLKAEGERGERG